MTQTCFITYKIACVISKYVVSLYQLRKQTLLTLKKIKIMTQKKLTITDTLRSMVAGEIMEFSHDEASPAVLRELGRKIGKFSVLGVRGEKSTIVKRIK